MAQIKLTPEELRTSAVKYTNGSTDIDNVLSILTSAQETIRENWEGTAFESFDNQFTELKPKIQEFSQLLQDINTQLNSVADTIEQTDQDIAGKIGF
ncbi:WXG100 family type VII secretion target [Mycobacteroides abscessus]|uniref:WXG100 family type VII secretion target n=1 Tax=unclassified Desemzia TaxID=2685243 RepID=UPI0009A70A70|nr:Virulence factor esxA [Mycobacteroides abscessus subsp. abscessus]